MRCVFIRVGLAVVLLSPWGAVRAEETSPSGFKRWLRSPFSAPAAERPAATTPRDTAASPAATPAQQRPPAVITEGAAPSATQPAKTPPRTQPVSAPRRAVRSDRPVEESSAAQPSPATLSPAPDTPHVRPTASARRLPGPRAARGTLGDDTMVVPAPEAPRRRLVPLGRVDEAPRNVERPGPQPTSETVPDPAPAAPARGPVVTAVEPVGEGIDPSTTTSVPEDSSSSAPPTPRPHIMTKRGWFGGREGTRPPTGSRRSANGGAPAPGLDVQSGELEEVQVSPPAADSSTRGDSETAPEDTEEPRSPAVTTRVEAEPAASSPSLTQRWRSWWGGSKKQ